MPGVLRSGHLRPRSLPAIPLRPPGPRPPAQPPARGWVSLRTEATREASEGSAGSASEERRVRYRKKQWVRPGSPGAQPEGKTRPQRGSCTLRLQGLQEPVKASYGGRAQLGGRKGAWGDGPGIAGTLGCNSVQKGTLSDWQGACFQEAHSPWTPSSGQSYLLIIPVEPEAHPLEILPQ